MSKVINKTGTEVEMVTYSAHCESCGCGNVIETSRKENGVRVDYKEHPENRDLIGKPCSCGGVLEGEYYEDCFQTRGEVHVVCDCGYRMQIVEDGQECPRCEQMYNMVGQKVQGRLYDNEWED